ncbi:MAG: LysR family transcriptional regulator [Nevskiaceae bacterium]|nr:MAG: LysR family transcriptional regulator [Nevskiaceae bacterium]TBR73702.1 MAG: LysR family transcriptional regulator [Nevskiaceae bacterium]
MMNITFRQLRIFSEAARQLSFAQAARNLYLTPPAVSMQVKELENQLGLPLFERSGRRVALTASGEYILSYARKMLAALKDTEDAVARLRQLETGTLTIGMVSTAEYFLPQLLARFQRAHEGVETRLRVGNREQLFALLEANEVDVAVMGRPPQGLATRCEAVVAHPHVFVAPAGHPLLAGGPLPVEVLHDQAFIVREHGSGTRAAMEEFLADAEVPVRVAMEMSSNETIKQAVIAGMGLSFLSLHTLGLELDAGRLGIVPVIGTPVVRSWNVVNTLSKVLPPVAEAFHDFLLDAGGAFVMAHFGRYLPADGAWQ